MIFLLSIPALIYIYRFSRKKKRVEISSIIPWRLLRESVVRTSLFRADLLFYLQFLLLLALVAAACRPYWGGREAPPGGRRLFIVMDRSASMNAREGRRSRWEIAVDRALGLLRRAGTDDRVTLIGAGAEPAVVVSSAKATAAAAALKRMEPADTPDRLAPAVGLAASLARGGGARGGDADAHPADIHVFTDRSDESLGLSGVAKPDSLHVVKVGKPTGNAAIISLAAYTEPFSAEPRRSLYATVENFSSRPFKGRLTVGVRGGGSGGRPVKLGPGEEETVMLAEGLSPGEVEVSLAPADALAVDNTAYAIFAGKAKTRIAIFSRDPRCREQFRKLGAAVPSFEIDIFRPEDYGSTDLASYDIAVFHGMEPAGRPPTNLLVIFPPPGSRLTPVTAERVPGVSFTDWDEGHPVGMNLHGLQKVPLNGCRKLSTPAWARPVVIAAAEGGDIPLVLCGRLGGRRVAVTAFDTAEIDFTRSRAMPGLVLVLNLIRWLAADQPESVLTGGVYETEVPATPASGSAGAAAAVEIEDPRGRVTRLVTGPGEVVRYAATDYTGLYRLRGRGVERRFVANLFDEGESDLRTQGGGEDRIEIPPVAAGEPAEAKGRPDKTPLFLSIALALMMVEWAVYSFASRLAKRKNM